MMNMAAQIDELWGQGQIAAPPPAFLETNRFLESALSAPRRQIRQLRRFSFEFLGEQIEWLHPEGSPFPQGVFALLEKLLEIASLREGWNGYDAKPLDMATVRPALELILAAHSRCALPRLIPLTDGGIGLRWESDHGLELDIDLVGSDGVEGVLSSLHNDLDIELQHDATLSDAVRLLEKFCETRQG